ncbi:Oidioi.mRNA.OKI2018_I69.PAR.g8621.t1.cds [Oikopleura dioica]|uniref:Oidioi.mRNA.OKI2018_I69.PAR.g8621.t1.cds n=1 Tax=Oikopleura dioica TaxID=34765 RepID=A0ABN7RJB5_OIKDI|nr:Oidioi.mRNA.OKI2018_I69.PAR.g8621.t1.cds [Oikopleura dioica]
MMKAKRCLFGPSDPELTHRQYNESLKQHLQNAEKDWNFNFADENPILSSEARYKWEVVRSSSVPPVYRSKRLFDPKAPKQAAEVEQKTPKTSRRSSKSATRSAKNSQLAKKSTQTTMTEMFTVKRQRSSMPKKVSMDLPGSTSPERVFGVLTRSTSRVHTRSTAKRHLPFGH